MLLGSKKKLKGLVCAAICRCALEYRDNLRIYIEECGILDCSTNLESCNIYLEKMCNLENGGKHPQRQKIENAYYIDVASYVFSQIGSISPQVSERISLSLKNPSLCGHHIESVEYPRAGDVYAISYFALVNKAAKQKDCESLSETQARIMLATSLQLFSGC